MLIKKKEVFTNQYESQFLSIKYEKVVQVNILR